MFLTKKLEQSLRTTLNRNNIKDLYKEEELGECIYSRPSSKANTDKQNEDKNRYDRQVEFLFCKIIEWSENAIPEAIVKWTALKEKFGNFYDSVALQQQGKEILETVFLVLANNDIENDKKISALKKIDTNELMVCAPGTYTHLKQFVSSLTMDSTQLIKEEVIKAHTLDFIQAHKALGLMSKHLIKEYRKKYQLNYGYSISKDEAIELVLEDWEIHYVNALMDAVSEEFALHPSKDIFTKCFQIEPSFISEFKRVLEKDFPYDFIIKLFYVYEENIQQYAGIKHLDDLSEYLNLEFGEENASALKKAILNFKLLEALLEKNAMFISELTSVNMPPDFNDHLDKKFIENNVYAKDKFYLNTALSKSTICFFILKKLITDGYIYSEALQQIELPLVGEAKIHRLFFLEEILFFLAFQGGSPVKLENDLINVIDMNGCIFLDNRDVFFSFLITYYDDQSPITTLIKIAHVLTPENRRIFISSDLVKREVRAYLKEDTINKLVDLVNQVTTAEVEWITEHIEFSINLEISFYDILNILESNIKEDKRLAFIKLVFKYNSIPNLDFYQLKRIASYLPESDQLPFFSDALVQRILKSIEIYEFEFSDLKKLMGNESDYIKFLQKYIENGDFNPLKCSFKYLILLISQLSGAESFKFISELKFVDSGFTLHSTNLNQLIAAIPSDYRLQVMTCLSVQNAIRSVNSPVFFRENEEFTALLKLFPPEKYLDFLKLDIIKLKLEKTFFSSTIMLEILKLASKEQRLEVARLDFFKNFLKKEISVLTIIKILELFPQKDRLDFFRLNIGHWSPASIFRSNLLDLLVLLNPEINKISKETVLVEYIKEPGKLTDSLAKKILQVVEPLNESRSRLSLAMARSQFFQSNGRTSLTPIENKTLSECLNFSLEL